MTELGLSLPASAAAHGRRTPLVERLGEEEFARFHAAVAPRLWGYLRSHVSERAEADDLTQEAFTRVLASTFEPRSDEHLVRYLYRTATNLLRDRGRRAGRGTTVPLAEAGEGDAAGSVRSAPAGLRIDLDRALQALRPKERQLLWLAHVEGLPHRAIAEIVGAGAHSIRVMLHRARRRLAQHLGRPAPAGKEEPDGH